MNFVSKNWKGILLCFCIALPSWILGRQFPIVGGPVIAILAGMVLTLLIKDKSNLERGIKYKNKPITPYVKNRDLIDLLKSETAFVDAFNRIFNIDISTINNEDVLKIKIPLNKKQLFTRIKREAQNKGNIYENRDKTRIKEF